MRDIIWIISTATATATSWQPHCRRRRERRMASTQSFLPSLAAAASFRQQAPLPKPANKLLFRHNISRTVPLFVGSLPQNVSMVLDIGSELSWLICNSCSAVALTSFDPNRSFTYSPVTCSSPTCRDSGRDLPMPPMCDASSQTAKACTATSTSPTLTPPPLTALSPPTNSSWAATLRCPPSSAAWVQPTPPATATMTLPGCLA
ncbi:hypothetical protein Cni_G14375 [Canna indica]|uniref:Peptidase A1 domain-containing protein n=1 Tax=Canna indica TaxID=4628 RepID=A0AAQ3QAM6_9LILI|nr:hypothetical protein Cni_G14375 [Canna indica]